MRHGVTPLQGAVQHHQAAVDGHLRFATGFAGRFVGFWAAFESASSMGHLCIPTGGLSTGARLQMILDNKVTVICCTPTYALRMAEVAAEMKIDLANSAVRALIVAGEPGGNIPETRKRIETAFGARLFDHTRPAGVGVIGIRVLAGGALSGSAERHQIAGPPPAPIGSASSYEGDLARARRLMALVKEGFATSLAEVATRFALSHPASGTILVGMATPQQFEDALAAVEKGPLPRAALDRLSALRQAFSGEPR